MNAEVFVDTNVLLYTIDEEPASNEKRERAQRLLLTERWGWSVQVAAEFFANAVSPRRPFRLAPGDAAALVETWLFYLTLPLTPDLVRRAIAFHQRFQLSYCDASILAAARTKSITSTTFAISNAGITVKTLENTQAAVRCRVVPSCRLATACRVCWTKARALSAQVTGW